MTITLQDLAAVATGTTTRSGALPFHQVSVEDARASVRVKDGNRKPAEDGTQKLTVVLGKYTLPLDPIKAGATRIFATEEQVEGYTEALLQAVSEGLFDAEITVAQERAKVKAESYVAAETVGLDLGAL